MNDDQGIDAPTLDQLDSFHLDVLGVVDDVHVHADIPADGHADIPTPAAEHEHGGNEHAVGLQNDLGQIASAAAVTAADAGPRMSPAPAASHGDNNLGGGGETKAPAVPSEAEGEPKTDMSSRSGQGEQEQEQTQAPPSSSAAAASPSSSTYRPHPIGTRLLLSQPSDPLWLTPYLCLLRRQLEVFSATPDEIAAKQSTGGNKVPPIPGQVGIRCVHCKGLTYKERAKNSESFPSCIKNVHQAVRNYQRHHYPKCQAIPPEIRTQVESIRTAKKSQKSRGSAGQYWMASCVQDLHMVDGKDGRAGIFFEGTEDAGTVPADVGDILGGESSSDAAASGTTKKKKQNKKKPKAPKIKRAIQSMFRREEAGAPEIISADVFAARNQSVHSGASLAASSLGAGTLNRNDIPQQLQQQQQQLPQQLLSNDSLRRHSTGGGNFPMPQQMHAAATMQMYSSNWELINNHGGASALTPPQPQPPSSALPMNLPDPAVVITGTNPILAPTSSIGDGFQLGTAGGNGDEGGRKSSFPAGGSEFPIEMFEPRPLREDGKGFVDESANDPAASAYFAASHQNPAQAPISASSMPVAGDSAGGDSLTNAQFQTEYGFMGINDVVKGHEEAEKRKASYRDRRSSWTSRDSHGSSTFLSSGSKRGLSDDGDSVGTNEYEPPKRRPSIQSSLGDDLDDFRDLDLDNDDFNDDFGMMDYMGSGSSANQPLQQPPDQSGLVHGPVGNATSQEVVAPEPKAAPAGTGSGTASHIP